MKKIKLHFLSHFCIVTLALAVAVLSSILIFSPGDDRLRELYKNVVIYVNDPYAFYAEDLFTNDERTIESRIENKIILGSDGRKLFLTLCFRKEEYAEFFKKHSIDDVDYHSFSLADIYYNDEAGLNAYVEYCLPVEKVQKYAYLYPNECIIQVKCQLLWVSYFKGTTTVSLDVIPCASEEELLLHNKVEDKTKYRNIKPPTNGYQNEYKR